MNHQLTSNDPLTKLAKAKGVSSWNELTAYVSKLPYGRNKNRVDLSLVLTEEKGTCSSKHALLKKLADLNEVLGVRLILGIYKMTQTNTPDIGDELARHSIEYVPEAHCYLEIDGEKMDFTTHQSDFDRIRMAIVDEIEIAPEQVGVFKIEYHQHYIRKWLADTESQFTFDQFWSIREQCIENLSQLT